MLNVVSLHRSSTTMTWGWTRWTFLCFVVSGALSLVTVYQPPELAAQLGQDAVLPCVLQVSHDEKMLSQPILYWLYVKEDAEHPKLWPPSETYQGRTELLDSDRNSSNKSVRLRSVQWADGGRHLCKLSVNTERDRHYRCKGDETSLLVYDAVVVNLTVDSLLRCAVNVTPDAGFALSIFHDGCRLQAVDSAPGDAVAARPYVTLSESVPLRPGGKYECQLRLREELVATGTFLSGSPEAGDGGAAERNVTRCPPGVPGVVVHPEPWLLYVGLLLVPVTVLLAVATATLMCR